MKQRRLGRSGLTVPPLCFGCNVFGWTADESESFRLLDRVVEADLTFFDTADVYSKWVPGHQGGESEAILGRWLASRGGREKLTIATKVGADLGEGRSGLSARRIKEAVDSSLQRLQTDYIDLYQSHADDPGTDLAETLGAYGDLIQAGKVRAIGASNYPAARLREALRLSVDTQLPRYESLQPLYNLVERAEFEKEFAQLCLDENVGVIPFYSLASGFLTGKYRSKDDLANQQRGNRVAKYLTDKGFRILQELDAIGLERAAAPGTVALAWLMAQPAVTAPIVSASRLDQLDVLLNATQLQLTPFELERLSAVSAPDQ